MKADDAFLRGCHAALPIRRADERALILEAGIALYLVHSVTGALVQVLMLAPSPRHRRRNRRYAALLYNTESGTFETARLDADVTVYVRMVREEVREG